MSPNNHDTSMLELVSFDGKKNVDSKGSHISKAKSLAFRASSGNFSVRIRSGAYTKHVKDGNIEFKLNGLDMPFFQQ